MSGPLRSLRKGVKLPNGKPKTPKYTPAMKVLPANENGTEWIPPSEETVTGLEDFNTKAQDYLSRKTRADMTLKYLLSNPKELLEHSIAYISDIRWFRYLTSTKHCEVEAHAIQSQEDFIKLGLPKLFKVIWNEQLKISSIGDWQRVSSDTLEAFYHISMAIWFICMTPQFQKQMFEELFEFVMSVVSSDAYKINYSKNRRMQDCLKALLGIMYQFTKNVDETKRIIREKGGVGFLQRITGHKHGYNKNVKGRAHMILAYTLTEDEQKEMKVSLTIISFLISLLKECIKTENHKSSIYNYDALEVLKGLNRLAISDANKHMIEDSGGIHIYQEFLEKGWGDERAEACRGLWTLCFNELVSEYVLGNAQLMSTLQQLTKSDHESTRIAACGCLWTVKELKDKNKAAAAVHKAGHIMISYNWSLQDQAKQVKQFLTSNGYRVWMDIENMSGSTLSSMSQAIEKSAVVLVFVSEQYKESAACRAEAEYAYKLQREIVPLKLEPGYTADGWLGMLIGMKMSFDLSRPEERDSAHRDLIAMLGERGKGPAITESKTEKSVAVEKPVFPGTSARAANSNGGTQSTHTSDDLDCTKWSDSAVTEWLTQHKLISIVDMLGGEMDGPLLTELKFMLEREPKQYYEMVRGDLQLSTVNLLRLSRSLRALR